jgi:hypothetical protein
MLSSLVTKFLKKESAMGIQVIVAVLLQYNTASVSLKHKFQLNGTQKFSFYFAVSTGKFIAEQVVNTV